jgi:Na+/H+ antiporter NhaD/arsenite permease-like protein
LSDTGLPDAIYWRLQPVFGSTAPAQAWNLSWFSVAGSNVFSNVPFVLVAANWVARFADPTLMWKVLALATMFAGNLTIVGSVANMIRGRIRARARSGRLLGLRAVWNSDYDP